MIVVRVGALVRVGSNTRLSVLTNGGDLEATSPAEFDLTDRGGHPPLTTLNVVAGTVTSRDHLGMRTWTAGTTVDLRIE